MLAVCLAMTVAQVPQIPRSREKPAKPTRAQLIEGEKLYRHYCASCHGLDGRGSGPVTPALKTIPPDLTRIEKKAGRFPVEELRKAIAGENSMDVHGTREMPVWGSVLPKKEIDSLVFYLESIQRLM